jgi:PQQ-dependent catabolism-associated CXXCW motif protein
MLALSGLDASAAGDYVDPKSITPPAATGDVPEPDGYRTDGYRMPVPRTLKGATVIDADAAEKLIKDSNGTIFLDVYPRAPKPANLPAGTVWRDMPHSSIAGAHWLPNVGYGVLSREFETYFKTRLATLTENDKSKPLVFFCLKDCWMSWNAAKRALSWGYTSVSWFPDGTDGWQAIGNDLIAVTPLP